MISNAYSYYLSMYGNKGFSRYDSHKRSDLKSTYNRMASINRSSPLYKIDFSDSTQKLAIDIKETAREIRNISYELNDVQNGEYTFKHNAESDNDEVADVKYIGNGNSQENEFTINVSRTADCQINTGYYMPADSKYLKKDTYSFDLSIEDVTYEFQFNVGNEDTTIDIQTKIGRLINNAGIGLNAQVITNFAGDTALEIRSNATGNHGSEPFFYISDVNTSHSSGSVDLLGINHITQMPDNAVYTIDDVTYESERNTFTYNDEYELTIKQPGTANVHISEDDAVLSKSLSALIENYNRTIELSKESVGKNTGNGRLYNEFTRLAHSYSEVLKQNGLNLNDEGRIEIDTQLLNKASEDGSIHDTINSLDKFRESIRSKADAMYSNPMAYVNKKIVAYKNPKNNYPNPYSDSAYAGMIFDGFY